jgi:hypothetical protein
MTLHPCRPTAPAGAVPTLDHDTYVTTFFFLFFCQATDEDGTKYLKGKAQLIEELESTLPDWVRRPHWYPPFVHMLKVGSLNQAKQGNCESRVLAPDDLHISGESCGRRRLGPPLRRLRSTMWCAL